jgi:flagellar protein FlbD
MIKLTRLNGDEFVVNADLIRFIESRPDTYVTLTTDDRLIVRESVDEVIHRAICYARALRLAPEVSGRGSAVGGQRSVSKALSDL